MTTTTATDKGIRALQSASDIPSESQRALYDYWLAKKGQSQFPTLPSIDVLDFPEDAKLWAIVDVTDEGNGFQYRFVGPGIVKLIEMEPTGIEYSDVAKGYGEGNFGTNMPKIYNLVLETNGPVINGPTHMPLPSKKNLQFSSFSLPLSHNGKTISEILTAVHIFREQ